VIFCRIRCHQVFSEILVMCIKIICQYYSPLLVSPKHHQCSVHPPTRLQRMLARIISTRRPCPNPRNHQRHLQSRRDDQIPIATSHLAPGMLYQTISLYCCTLPTLSSLSTLSSDFNELMELLPLVRWLVDMAASSIWRRVCWWINLRIFVSEEYGRGVQGREGMREVRSILGV